MRIKIAAAIAGAMLFSAPAFAQDANQDDILDVFQSLLGGLTALEPTVLVDVDAGPNGSVVGTASIGPGFAETSVMQATETGGVFSGADAVIEDEGNESDDQIISINDGDGEGNNRANALAIAFSGEGTGIATAELMQELRPTFLTSTSFSGGAIAASAEGSASISNSFNNNNSGFTIIMVNQAGGTANNQANVASINFSGGVAAAAAGN